MHAAQLPRTVVGGKARTLGDSEGHKGGGTNWIVFFIVYDFFTLFFNLNFIFWVFSAIVELSPYS
jgi:hypothetical protein